MLSSFIHKGRPTTTKPTFVALPSLTSHSTFYECLRSILCQPQESPHSLWTRLGVIISYSLHQERKITSPSTSIISPCVYSEPSDEPIEQLYGFPSNETTSMIIEVKIDRRHQFQVNRLNIARDTSIKARPKNSSQNLNFCIPTVTLTLI